MRKNITLIPINVQIRKIQLAISMLSSRHHGIISILQTELNELKAQRSDLVKKQNALRVKRWRKKKEKKNVRKKK